MAKPSNGGHEVRTNGLMPLELCAGGGGQALGLEQAGFNHQDLVEIDHQCCETLRFNCPSWKVFEQDIETFDVVVVKSMPGTARCIGDSFSRLLRGLNGY